MFLFLIACKESGYLSLDEFSLFWDEDSPSISAYHKGTQMFDLIGIEVDNKIANRIKVRDLSNFVMGDVYTDDQRVAIFELWPAGSASIQLEFYGLSGENELILKFNNDQHSYWGLGHSNLNGSTQFTSELTPHHPEYFSLLIDSSAPRGILFDSNSTNILSSSEESLTSQNEDYFNAIFSIGSTEQILTRNNKMLLPTDEMLFPWINIDADNAQPTEELLTTAQGLGPVGMVVTSTNLGGWKAYSDDLAYFLSSQDYKWIARLESSFEINDEDEHFNPPILSNADGTPVVLNNKVHLDLNSADLQPWLNEQKERLKTQNIDGWSAELRVADLISIQDTEYLKLSSLWSSFLVSNEPLIVGSNVLQDTVPTHFIAPFETSSDSIRHKINTSMSGFPYQTSSLNEESTYEDWKNNLYLSVFFPLMSNSWPSNSEWDEDLWTIDWSNCTQERARLWPYLRAHSSQKTLRFGPPQFQHPSWDIPNSWMLGSELLIIANDSAQIQLPDEHRWFSYWTGEELSVVSNATETGYPIAIIPENSVIPVFKTPPNSVNSELFEDADRFRTVRLFGSQGSFTEADGTTYVFTSTASELTETQMETKEGQLELEGLTLDISGPKVRHYTVIHTP